MLPDPYKQLILAAPTLRNDCALAKVRWFAKTNKDTTPVGGKNMVSLLFHSPVHIVEQYQALTATYHSISVASWKFL